VITRAECRARNEPLRRMVADSVGDGLVSLVRDSFQESMSGLALNCVLPMASNGL